MNKNVCVSHNHEFKLGNFDQDSRWDGVKDETF